MQEKSGGQPSLISPTTKYPLALLGLGIICLDVFTKALALSLPTAGIWMVNGIGLKLTMNSGMAFGLGRGWLPLALQLIATMAVLAWLWHLIKTPSGLLLRLPATIIASGAIANVIDRLVDGRITDFVVLGSWPAFNAADTAVTIGVILALTHSWPRR
jgi:signal peptidase II